MRRNTLLAAALLTRGWMQRTLFERALSGMALLIGLAVAGGIIASALLLGGCYFAYGALLERGIGTGYAALATTGLMMGLLLVCVAAVQQVLRRLQRVLWFTGASDKLSRLGEAFLAGWRREP